MLLKCLVVLLVAGVNNAETEKAVDRQWPGNILGDAVVQMIQNPIYRPWILRSFIKCAQVPEYDAKVFKIFQFLRFPQLGPSNFPLTEQVALQILQKIQNPSFALYLVDAVYQNLAAQFPQAVEQEQDIVLPWPDVPGPINQLSGLAIPLLRDPQVFRTVVHQIANLLQEPDLKASWIPFIRKLELPVSIRRAMLKSLYSVIDNPDAKPFAIHAIILTLQQPQLRPIFMKQFFELLLSRTIPHNLALQVLKIVFSPTVDADLIRRVLEYPRIRYRIAAMILNVLFEPQLRELVIDSVLETVRHPMFFPLVVEHTQQIMLQLMDDPEALDYALALFSLPPARLLTNSFVLMFLRQPVQVAFMEALMQKNQLFAEFLQEVFNEPEVQPVVVAIWELKHILKNSELHQELIPMLMGWLSTPVRVYVSSYMLNLYYQPALNMQTLLTPYVVLEMRQILQEEINARRIFVQTVKFECEKEIALINPQPPIPAIPVELVFDDSQVIDWDIWIPYPQFIPELVPVPMPLPPPPPSPSPPFPMPCPPPMIIHEPVFIPVVPDNQGVAVAVTTILQIMPLRNFGQINEIMQNLLMNPLTLHQGILQILQHPQLRPYLIDVIDRMLQDPQTSTSLSPALLTAFRKTAQDTVIFRDILQDEQLFAKFQDVFMKLSSVPGMDSELYKFYVDFIRNSGADPATQEQAVSLLSAEGMNKSTFNHIAHILRRDLF